MKVTILAPAYNEEDAIDQFVGAVVPHLDDDWEILVVDDGSTDSTPQRLEHSSIRIDGHNPPTCIKQRQGKTPGTATDIRYTWICWQLWKL